MLHLKRNYFLVIPAVFILLLTIACSSTKTETPVSVTITEEPEETQTMTLRDKVGQLFVIRPESIDETITLDELHDANGRGVKEVTSDIERYYKKYPAGGFALFARNIENPQQIKKFTTQLHQLNNTLPLIFIDEEGGVVSRIAKNKNFTVPVFKNMTEIGNTENTENAYKAGKQIGAYLKEYGFDVDFAPVADVNTNPNNPVIGTRAFSNNPAIAAKMDVTFLDGLHENKIYGCLKHFPGHGDTKTDTHNGYAETTKNWQELLNCEMVTFKAGIDNGVRFIMTAHISAPEVTGTDEPATVSSILLTEKLRKELGYNGIIITDAMEMGAIRKVYSSSEAAIKAIKAGADIVLMPYDYAEAFEGVLKAIETGELTEERIDESVSRIMALKS